MKMMNTTFFPGVGGILSADIAVPEHARELSFYSSVLTTGERPLWRDDLMNSQGVPVIGLGERTAEYESLPLQWMPHMQVADVAASVACALKLGGAELWHAKDDGGNSQWAVLEGPEGAAFGIIPEVSLEEMPRGGGDEASRSGRISWLSLTVADTGAAREFYQQVVGWSAKSVEAKDTHDADFHMLGPCGILAASLCHAGAANDGVPPVWLLHLPVGDLYESLRRVQAGGGEVIWSSEDADGACTSAVVRDPVGAHFALVP